MNAENDDARGKAELNEEKKQQRIENRKKERIEQRRGERSEFRKAIRKAERMIDKDSGTKS